MRTVLQALLLQWMLPFLEVRQQTALLCLKCVTVSSLCCCNLPFTFSQCIAC